MFMRGRHRGRLCGPQAWIIIFGKVFEDVLWADSAVGRWRRLCDLQARIVIFKALSVTVLWLDPKTWVVVTGLRPPVEYAFWCYGAPEWHR